MYNNIDDNSIVICTNSIKKDILLNQKELRNVKFFTLKEFINNYFGTYKSDAVYFIMKQQGCSYEVAKMYLDNLFYNYKVLKDQYNDLESNNLLVFNKHFKDELKEYKKIYVIGLYLDKYIKDILDNYDVTYLLNDDNNCKKVDVYEFNSQTEELNYVLIDIIKKHIDNLNDVYLVNVNDSYTDELKRLTKMYHLQINNNDNNYIYSLINVKEFISDLKLTRDINESISIIKDEDIKNKIIDVYNKYDIDTLDDIYLDIIISEIKRIKIDNDIYSNAINVIGIDDIYLKDKYYYILNFNQGIVPKIFHDDDFISDKNKKELGINTSLDKYLIEKKKIVNIISNFDNITISYKLKDFKEEYLPSPLINELELNVIKDANNNDYSYSSLFNKISLGMMLDNYNKYNVIDKDINNLLATYNEANYRKYDNQFDNVDIDLLKDFINNKLYLSYTSMDNFYHCPFRYYVKYILKLDKYEDKFAAFIGDLFHYVLSKMYEDNFDSKKEYDEYLRSRELTVKEKFFVEKLYSNLERVIEIIRMQDKHSMFEKPLLEEEITVEKDNEINIIFGGKIDKIKYYKENDITFVSIIDYKTGGVDLSLDNIDSGFNLQLPVYVYLIKKYDKSAKVCGFYLQKTLKNVSMDSEDVSEEEEKNMKLIGYTIDDEDIIRAFDDTYKESKIISGMKINADGAFNANSKVISEENIDKIANIVDGLIDNMIATIKKGEFKISPKDFKDKDQEVSGCKYCSFKDLCYMNQENVDAAPNKKFEDIIGGEEA